jgi:L-fuculose-phosphate aldolase
MQSESELKAALARVSQRLWQRGWVANHDGNLTVRLRPGRFLCTPTARSKRELEARDMLLVDGAGKRIAGTGKPFSELALHLAWFREREDVEAVVHAHPPVATAFGCSGADLPHPFLPEAVVSLGPVIPTVPLSMPGKDAEAALVPYLAEHDALLVAGNGAFACGRDLEMAYLRMELLEHLCQIARDARALGGLQRLPAHMLEPLLAARQRAGLDPKPARAAADSGPHLSASELSTLVQSEIKRVLG